MSDEEQYKNDGSKIADTDPMFTAEFTAPDVNAFGALSVGYVMKSIVGDCRSLPTRSPKMRSWEHGTGWRLPRITPIHATPRTDGTVIPVHVRADTFELLIMYDSSVPRPTTA